MVGSLEYYKGNIDTALHVLGGPDVAAVTPKIRFCISSTISRHKRRFKRDAMPVMPINDASLLVEAIYLKAKSLQTLGRHKGRSSLSTVDKKDFSHYAVSFVV
ncbi:hypothetical protein ACHQM5_011595 [Ranunculus cassubicifolius]